ncbi:VOC family protein [Compostibacter hankyongensis]|uniref:VOC family protein n=1 Tax=Compostibacter hankyongensis TaxID=1007089 RepID=A0ABP8FL67_9BACT
MSTEQHHRNHAIDYIEFAGTDLERIKAFYRQAFGWQFTDWGAEYTSFEDGRLSGGFYQSATVAPGGPLVILYSEHLEKTQQQVEAAGGRILKPIYSFPGGRRFHFADPDGNELAVWSE